MANSNKHGKQTLVQGIHGTIAYEYDNAPARLAATGFQPEDLYKQAIQLDNKSVWILTSISPIIWAAVGSNPSLIQGISAGTTIANGPNVVFSNSNGVSFGANGSTITASVQPSGLAAVLAGTQTVSNGTLSFSNSNGITFGISNSVLTASILPGAAAGIGAVQGGTQTQISGTLAFINSNGLTFGMSNSSQITASYTVPTTAGLISNINISAGTTSNNLSAFTFSNSNGLSFGINNSIITGSYTVPTQTNQTAGLYAVGNTTAQSSSSTVDARSLSFQGTGGVSVGYSNGSIIISGNTGGGNGSINVSAGTTSNNLTNFVFSNSNNVSFGLNGSTVTATITVPTQTNQTVGLYALGNTTQNSSTTLDARSLSFNGLGIVTAGYSNGSIQISATQSAQTQNIVVPSAGTQTATSGTVVFSNSNGISFGMSNSSVITASYTVPSTAGLLSNINISAGTTSNNLTNFVFSNSNNVSFGLNGSTVTATITVPAQTNQTVGLYALGNTTQNSSTTLDARTLSFNGLGAATVGYSNGSIQISVPTQTAQTQSLIQAIYDGTNSISTGTIRFTNANGVSFSINGQTISGSVAAQTNQTVGLYALGNTTQNSSTTLDARSISFNGLGAAIIGYSNGSIQVSVPSQTAFNFSNSNNVTFGANGSTITASASFAQTAQTQSLIQGIYDGANSITTGTIRFTNANGVSFSINGQTISGSVAAQTNQTIGLYALGNTTQNSSTTLDARTLSFNGLGIVTAGYSNGSIQISATQSAQTAGLYAVGNTVGQSSSSTFDARTLSFSGAGIASVGYSAGNVIISVPAAGANINFSAGTTSGNIGAVTFSNSNGISFGLNNGVITATVTPGAAAGIAAIQGGTQTATSGTVSFANSNGISFGLSNSSIMTASYTVPTQSNQTVGLYALGNTTQNSSTTLDARSISFNGLGAATVGYSNGSIQISVPTQTAQTQSNIQAIYDGANSISTGTIRYSNSNGVSFGINGQTLTASIAAQTNQTVGLYAVSNTTGASSSTTVDARSLSFQGAGVASVGYSNGSVIISVPTGVANVNVSAGTTSNNLTNFVFSNSNNVSFGLNGSTVTATVTVPAQTNQTLGLYGTGNTTQSSSTVLDARSLTFNGLGGATVGFSNGSIQISAVTTAGLISAINISAGTTSNNLTAITFNNSNGLAFGLNGSVITGSYTVPTQSVQTQNIVVPSAGTQSATSGTVVFSNSNGISFGMSNSSVITASYTVPTQTNQTIGGYASGNTTGQSSSSTIDARSLSFNGAGAVSLGYSAGSLVVSAPVQTSLSFSNLNGLTFGIAGSTLTGSYTVPTQTNQTAGLYALGNTTGQSSSSTFDARTMSFSGAGAASVGYSAGNIIVSVPVALTNINISAGTTSNNLTNFVFSNSNNVSFGLNGSTVTATVTVPAQTAQTVGLYGLGNTTQNSSTILDARSLSFNGLGNVTVGYSNGSIQLSVTQSSLSYSNLNGVTFGLNASTLTASVAAQTNQTVGLYGLGNTTQNSSTTLDARSLSFNGLGIITAGYSNGSIQISATQSAQTQSNIQAIYDGANSITTGTIRFTNANGVSFSINGQTISGSVAAQTNQTIGLYAVSNTTGASSSSTVDARSLSFQGAGVASVGYSNGSVVISVPSGGGGITNVNISAGTTSNNLSAFVFSNSNNVSFGLNGSTITGSISRAQVSYLNWPEAPWQTNFPISNASFSLQHFNAKANLTANKANLLMALNGNTDSTGAMTISLGIYTMNGSTASLASSDSRAITWTSGSQTTNSTVYGGISGTRYRTVSLNNWSVSAGDYLLGMWFRTTNNGTWNAFGIQGPTIVGAVDANETNHYLNGYSTSSYSTAMVASINVTDTNYVRTGGNAFQQPSIIFLGTF